ncbi:UDP-glycosyltransferase UGT5-like isoform X2 [Macrosteles quadrilineatus]|uniref:UDP-glycosyltransferase UGT5-like isoform X2 n=1 Tax=Macrosteles quadrilineatus TaxID=74068 RepID=UPI0023E1F9C2|nr:UDP-glycosyltransferase UGT5-like isoform X2 [Macrosteles quadrilineatus]
MGGWVRSVLVISALVYTAYASDVLVVTPTLSKSHFAPFGALIDELLNRGHRVTLITTFPREKPVQNLTEISVASVRKVIVDSFEFSSFSKIPETFWDVAGKFTTYIEDTTKVLNVPEVRNLIASNSTFDLIIYEMFIDDLFLGFAHKFKAPVIAIGSCYMFPYVPDRFAIPANPASFPGFYSWYSDKMHFIQRLHNVVLDLGGKALYRFSLEPLMTKIAREHFGSDMPPVGEMIKTTSLYFINTHSSMFAPHPYPPQVVDISGIHLKPAKPLSQELDSWLKESPAGVIYFSFGSMLRGATLPSDKVRAFLEAFRGYSIYRVLWKWEDDTMDNIPYNVKIMKWLPQRDVLAHPAVKLFISHGGLLGTTEAVVSGVPILGIPMYGDQPNNVAALVDKGVAIHIDYNNITASSIKWALGQLLTDTGYTENAKALSQRFQDRPMSPLDTAVFWTEYVIRHKGAPHLRSAAVDLTWYQYYLLDVTAFCIITVLAVLAAAYYAVKSFIRCIGFSQSVKVKAA